MKQITSPLNPEIKHIIKLHQAKERKHYKQCIAEGFRTLSTLLEGNLKLLKLYVTEEHLQDALPLTTEDTITIVSEPVMKKISTATTPSGILGLFAIPPQPDLTHLKPGLVLAQISDPGNMGTLIRTAVACGTRTVVVIEGVDPWSAKVIQASAGTIGWVTLFEWDWNTLVQAKGTLRLCALVVERGEKPTNLDPLSSLLIVGNEAHGIPQDWLNDCDQLISLPMPGGTESLNAAIAGSIALYLTFVKLC
jgi:RNA methyltransferase, TrmH family